MKQLELLLAGYTIIFQARKIYNVITEKYIIDYVNFNIDKIRQINGNAKEKIHDVMVEIFNQKQTGIEIETIEDVDGSSIFVVDFSKR